MKQLLFVLTFLVALDAGAARRRVAQLPPESQLPAVDAIAEDALAEGIPGLTIAVRKGDELFVKGYGLHDVEQQVPARAHSVYQIGSITKQFTAAAILLLEERGMLSVRDSIRQHIPELAQQFDRVTIEHLLVHTSGVADHLENIEDPWEPMTAADLIAAVNAKALAFTPGTRWDYSNSAYYLLGIAIERLSGRTYARFLEENFFLPLGLLRSSYCGDGVPDGYVRIGEETYRFPAVEMSLVHAAGAICSTAADLVRWNEALESGRAISSQSYEKLTTRYRIDGRLPIDYGYGVALDPLDGRRRVWHNGLISGFSAHLAWYPDEGLTIAVLVNIYIPDEDPATAIANEIARALKQD